MTSSRGKKSSISFTISQKILKHVNSMIQSGKFTSISDVVSTSIMLLIAERTNPDFDYSEMIENIPEDNTDRTKISAALNGYLDSELEKIAKVTNKNKSFIVRMALFRFFEFYKNSGKVKERAIISEDKPVISKSDMKEMIHEIINEAVPEIVDEYLKNK